jgi:EAL domain-containing protein (putative c-di-GMP-specific phosphodiesterase class I)
VTARTLVGPGGVDQVLELARRHLDMDIALLSEFADGRSVARRSAGDAESFGCEIDEGPPLGQSYCRAMVAGEIPQAIPDALLHPTLRDLMPTAAANIRAYVGVPIRLSDGTVYGSLCTLSHHAQNVDERDAKFLTMLAELVAQDVEAERRLTSERARLRELIDSDRVQIALQPIVDVVSGQLVGLEALSRFPADQGTPDRVFAAADALGVGLELERFAARSAFELLPMIATDRYLAVNLSPSAAIELSQTRADIPYHRLVLEITEHALIENYASLRDSLAWARERGLRLAIDDAGAGYASLHHIVELAPDIIKIDRSLVHGMSSNPALCSVAKAFVSLARDIGASVVAEGVEQAADLDAVRGLGIGAAQGYLLARPSTDRDQLSAWQSGTSLSMCMRGTTQPA